MICILNFPGIHLCNQNLTIMKKVCILFIVLLGISLTAGAQAFFRLGVGGAVSTASSMVYSYDYTGSNELTYSKKNGYGSGLPMAIAGGYYFNENFGFELGADYFYGLTSKYYVKSNYSDMKFKTHGTMLSIVPALVGKFDLDKLSPYARLGLMIGVMNSIIMTGEGTSMPEIMKSSSGEIKYKQKLSGGIALGVQAAVGSEFHLGELFSLFGEFQLYGISYAPKKGAFKTYTVNGENHLDKMTTKDKEWKYLKELDENKEIPDSDPNEYCRINYHFNNIGIVIGAKINLK